MTPATTSSNATALAPSFADGPVDIGRDFQLKQRYFEYPMESGLVCGIDFSVMVTLERPLKAVWPVFKDFNLWQNPYGYYYSGVIGDLEGRRFALGSRDNLGAERYSVLKVIPQHLIVISQPPAEDGSNGRISPGFHVFTLDETDGHTLVSAVMQHATRSRAEQIEQGRTHWRTLGPKALLMWRDSFIPALKGLLGQAAASQTPRVERP